MGVPKLGVSSNGGILAYAEPARVSLVWVTRTGLETPVDLPPRQFQFVRISGDGQRIAFADEASIWVADLTRGGSTRVSSERFIYGSLDWSPDDSQLAYSALYNLVTRAVDGTGTPRQLGATLPVWKLAPSWSPDGKTIAYSAYFGATNADIYVQAADGSSPPRAFVVTPAYDAGPQFRQMDDFWRTRRPRRGGWKFTSRRSRALARNGLSRRPGGHTRDGAATGANFFTGTVTT